MYRPQKPLAILVPFSSSGRHQVTQQLLRPGCAAMYLTGLLRLPGPYPLGKRCQCEVSLIRTKWYSRARLLLLVSIHTA